ARRRRYAARCRIEQGQDHAAAVEVMARSGVALAFASEEPRVEGRGLVEIRDLERDAKELRRVQGGGLGSVGDRTGPVRWVCWRRAAVERGPAGAHVCAGPTGWRWRSQASTTWRTCCRFRR